LTTGEIQAHLAEVYGAEASRQTISTITDKVIEGMVEQQNRPLDPVYRLAERARKESWTHEEFLVACLQREVSAREAHGGEGRIRAARFPARKSLEEFDFDHARGLKRDTIAHLGTLDFVTARDNVVFLGPPGTGKTHLAIGLGIRACQAGHRVAFATASEWVARLAEARHTGRLQAELVKLGRIPLLIVDEVGYIPFEAEAANPVRDCFKIGVSGPTRRARGVWRDGHCE